MKHVIVDIKKTINNGIFLCFLRDNEEKKSAYDSTD
jgi:hypothetical protein